ncbi:haloacid dehalogenase superfamily, subfamily IA, variant 3 with third motif having DD or ED/haloacid dehalogenase superfamily, subfamily IA, variant 1 with third motif having Dx(3-4)D or Dx(3-4)E [Izhakiella capsodis]|uniref:Haloacid dehalogenase superfamily, subfamily IA, variant 3 with third motif having DD or ED/haloacid dehalogenase superfamily, subfamily IA, variant 1 with third motif having Dx(3-4)D or Dx(3-4)E n=1 Tax=Izhakiella capsodis TaxID=1367852 RepID=A0A1I4ZYT4_9GAMM|nr:6-phosphogluconate phosphatase [Izhakiella capsodis]SFN55326.1 haloacid dehalogenase superfamily, subfamily IA, variant 3 with third motif having DD or ED/haloacid dehalogenase superfamily, subfamily IA, variant 1 with third motif having Dx(3-4)D or Dx(3-4)E [Izhakiella capsodis]
MAISCIFFDCDGTLVDSEAICTQAYVNTFERYDITLSVQTMFEKYKGVQLYDIVNDVCARYEKAVRLENFEPLYRAEVARLFDLHLQPIAGAKDLIAQIKVGKCVVSNGTVQKMQHSLGLTGMLPYFGDKLFSGYDINAWKPDPKLMQHAAQSMRVPLSACILVDDSEAGAKAGIAANIPVFYYCADAHNPPLDHPRITPFYSLDTLPALWRERGWQLTHF